MRKAMRPVEKIEIEIVVRERSAGTPPAEIYISIGV